MCCQKKKHKSISLKKRSIDFELSKQISSSIEEARNVGVCVCVCVCVCECKPVDMPYTMKEEIDGEGQSADVVSEITIS
jgi:hypothetical protein